jgi:DNA polymerase-3 subunit delta'
MELLGGAQFDPLGTGEELKDGTPAAVVAVLQKWSYDLASRKSVGIVRYNPDHSDALAALAERLDRLEILRFHRRMVRLQRVVRHPLNARLFLEDLFLSCAGLLRGTVTARAA